MRWSIGRKLALVAATSIVALSVLAAIGLATNEKVAEATRHAAMKQVDKDISDALRRDALALLLVATEIIVDGDAGEIGSERRQRIERTVAALEAGSKRLLARNAGKDSSEAARRVADAVTALNEIVAVDLLTAIESGADPDDIALLDDLIDAVREQVDEDMAAYEREAQRHLDMALTAADDAINSSDDNLKIAFGAALALLLPMFWFAARGVSVPVRSMTDTMLRLSKGDLDVEVPSLGRTDEVGEMAAAVEVFKNNAVQMRRLEQEQEEIKRRADEEKRRAGLEMTERLEAASVRIAEVVREEAEDASRVAEKMSAVAGEVRDSVADAGKAADRATANAQAVAAAIQQLAAASGEINVRASNAAEIADRAAQKGAAAQAAVADLKSSGEMIGDVISTINAIAKQTSLLALNATIEAARAGEAGAGFAVVANEVKALANQTARATEKTTAQVQGIQAKTEESAALMDEMLGTIGEIGAIASSISASVDEQSAATEEIARNVEQSAASAETVSSNVTAARSVVQQTDELAQQVLDASAKVVVNMYELKDTMTRTLRNSQVGDRRRTPRAALAREAMLRIGGRPVQARTVDLSPLGARLAVPDAPAPQAGSLSVDFGEDIGTVAASVVWAKDKEFGVEFQNLTADQRKALSHLAEKALDQ